MRTLSFSLFLRPGFSHRHFWALSLLGAALLTTVTVPETAFAGRRDRETPVVSYEQFGNGRIHQANESVGRGKPYVSDAGSSKKSSGQRAGRGRSHSEKSAMHGDSWAFGGGQSARAWDKGIDGDTMHDNALKHRNKSSIHARTEAQAETLNRKKERSDGVRLSIDQAGSAWRTESSRRNYVDEKVSLGGHHRVNAFAGVKEDDLTVGLGPQIIVKDTQQVHDHIGKTDDPNVDAGVGMQFKLDF